MRRLVLLLCAAGCGRAGYDARSGGDASPDGGGSLDDASGDASTGPFGEALPIEPLADPGADDDPSLTGDLRELYFKSDRGGGQPDIWRTTRDSPGDPWGDPAPVPELNSPQFDGTPEVSLDGLTITLSSDRDGAPGGIDLYVSTRADRDDDWGDPQPLVDLNSNEQEYAAVMDAAGEVVVFNRSVPAQSFDLFAATRDGAGWTEPFALVNLSSTAYEADSHLDGSGLELYFAGELPGGDGRDIYRSERDATGQDFAPPERVVELSSPMADEDPWVSPGGNLIVFSSDRSGDQEIYFAER